MSKLDVRIVKLEPQHVAGSSGFGPAPEALAWATLLRWAETRGLLSEPGSRRFFGYNNPSPSVGSPNYGYDQWITVEPDEQGEGDVGVAHLSGGLYAVTRCTLSQIVETWHELVAWREDSPYQEGQHQWLEEALNPTLPGANVPFNPDTLLFDLYLPIAK